MTTNWITVVLGASPNNTRYAYKAVTKLTDNGFPVMALGLRKGTIEGCEIITDWPTQVENLKVVTLYIGPSGQEKFYEYIIQLQPKKVIFNPGTENPELYSKLDAAGITYEEACTLVLLSTGAYSDVI